MHQMFALDIAENVRVERLDANGVVRDVLAQARNKFPNTKVNLRGEVEPGLNTIMGDEGLLLDALNHLIHNAVQHTPPGGLVALRVSTTDNTVVLEVSDTGTGIAPEHHGHIFERFYKVNDARTQDGSGAGLGLAVVRRVAELHGGTVTLESTPGRGSIFRLYLPR
jgi:two-component system OmpR family sensor kinase